MPYRQQTLVAGSGGFRGRVLDADGTPVARANVTLIDRRGRQAGLTTADEDGRYVLLPPSGGPYVLAGSATGHTPHARPAEYAGDGLPVDVDLILGTGLDLALDRDRDQDQVQDRDQVRDSVRS